MSANNSYVQFYNNVNVHAVVMCQALAPPTNGDITFSTDTTAPFDALTTAVYSCDARYTLSDGDQVRTCVSNEEGTEGMWTGTMPMCKGQTVIHAFQVNLKSNTVCMHHASLF